jgi:polysaccharide chain length determinant protein (PEP-CTERM system associated)
MALQNTAASQKSSSTLAGIAPLSIARMLWKRKLSIALIWIIVSGAGLALVSKIPPVYKAYALILVDSQKIPEQYVSSTVVSDVQDRLTAISQQILSSGRLQQIIDEFDLYRQEREQHDREEILEMMKRDLEITPEKGWTGRTVSFRVSYQGQDPKTVADVANRIADLYVQENYRTREGQAEGTTEFIQSQLDDAKKKLDELEAQVSQFKIRYNGELPQQEASINSTLDRLQVELEANRDAINRAQQSKVMLQDSLRAAEQAEQSVLKELRAAPAPSSSGPAAPVSSLSAPAYKPRKSEILEAELSDLMLRYTEDHPEIRRRRAELERVRRAESLEAVQSAAKPDGKTAGAGEAPARQARAIPDPPELVKARERIAALHSQIALLNTELLTREAEQKKILANIALYQSRVSNVPVREQQMAQITRDYEITKANYRSLLDKKIAAEMAADMEQRQKAERFTIFDRARPPEKPFKPNRIVLNLAACVVGLVFGLAYAAATEYRLGAILGEWELPSGVAVLGRVPRIEIASHVTNMASDPPAGNGATGSPMLGDKKLGSAVLMSLLCLLKMYP